MEDEKIKVLKHTKHSYCKCCAAYVEKDVYSIEVTAIKTTQFIDLCKEHLETLVTKINKVLEETI